MSRLAKMTYPSLASGDPDKLGGVAAQPVPIQQNLPARGATLQPSADSPGSTGWMQFWPEIQAQIMERSRLLLGLGCDGILSQSPTWPRHAALPIGARALLDKLGSFPRIALAFFSGRPLRDMQTRLRLQNAFYVGNHGMQICGPNLASCDGLAVSCRSDLVDALAFLARCTKRLPGILIEDKGMTVTVHWRLSDPSEREALRGLMKVIVGNHPRLSAVASENCWDLRARAAWNKGDALRQILSHLNLTSADAIHIGDGVADEEAFSRLPDGLTFSMGDATATAARFHLAELTDAAHLLSRVLDAVSNERLE